MTADSAPTDRYCDCGVRTGRVHIAGCALATPTPSRTAEAQLWVGAVEIVTDIRDAIDQDRGDDAALACIYRIVALARAHALRRSPS